jgi:hypothetical protein
VLEERSSQWGSFVDRIAPFQNRVVVEKSLISLNSTNGTMSTAKFRETMFDVKKHVGLNYLLRISNLMKFTRSDSFSWATANQHPSPVHLLAVLSIGWATFFHPPHHPAVTNIVPQSTFFLAVDIHNFFVCHFFSNLTSILPSCLATLLTNILAIPTN